MGGELRRGKSVVLEDLLIGRDARPDRHPKEGS
jgi:hypothetical protein